MAGIEDLKGEVLEMIRKALYLNLAMLAVFALQSSGEAQDQGPNQIPSASVEKYPASCEEPRFRQFDFWIGNWDVVDFGGTSSVAHVRVDPILNGCVLHEDYKGADGHEGQSFSTYDSAKKVWRQYWVTNGAESLSLSGNFRNGAITLTGKLDSPNSSVLVRGVWRAAGAGVRETAYKSSDGGKTWKPWFDLLFRRENIKPPANE